MTNSKIVAAFDFDGTITRKDTLFEFIKHCFGQQKMVLGLIITSPVLILYKLGIIPNYKAKTHLFSYFFKGMEMSEFSTLCLSFEKKIYEFVNVEAIDRVKFHQEKGHIVIIVSASISNWIQPFAGTIGINKVIGTELEVREGKLTGHFLSKNCYGPEKVIRIKGAFPDWENILFYGYGDSKGDKELLEFSKFAYYRRFE